LNSRLARQRLALASVLLASASALAGDYGFKGVNLGSHVSLIANNPKYDCKAVITPTADRICNLRKNETETIAGAPVASLFYFYDQAILTGISIGLEEKYFQSAIDALGGKYGPPTLAKANLKNLKGQDFENRIYTWRVQGESIVAERYSGRLDRSSVRISQDGAADRIRQRRDTLTRQPHKDL
jgi:hypothetical protein